MFRPLLVAATLITVTFVSGGCLGPSEAELLLERERQKAYMQRRAAERAEEAERERHAEARRKKRESESTRNVKKVKLLNDNPNTKALLKRHLDLFLRELKKGNLDEARRFRVGLPYDDKRLTWLTDWEKVEIDEVEYVDIGLYTKLQATAQVRIKRANWDIHFFTIYLMDNFDPPPAGDELPLKMALCAKLLYSGTYTD